MRQGASGEQIENGGACNTSVQKNKEKKKKENFYEQMKNEYNFLMPDILTFSDDNYNNLWGVVFAKMLL